MSKAAEPATRPTTMQAIVQDRYGLDPSQIVRPEHVPRPAIKKDEVLVRIRAAGVDRGTWHLMAGLPKLMRFIGFGLRGPKTKVPGLDMAGTVEAVGEDVTGFQPGDEVFGFCSGAFAEYACARADQGRAEAGEPHLRTGGRRSRLRNHRPPRPA